MRPQDALPGGASTESPPVGNGPQEAMACPSPTKEGRGARFESGFLILIHFSISGFFWAALAQTSLCLMF